MEIFKTKKGVDPQISNIIKEFKYNNSKIVVKGSNNYINQKYFSDYDLFTSIPFSNSKKTFDNIVKIINNTNNDPNLYFIEMKLQKKNGEKIKYFKPDDFKFNDFNKIFPDLDYIKLDYVVRIENIFYELSVIYSIKSKNRPRTDFIKNILNDIEDLKKEGNYFKILKKIFSINSYYNRNNRPIDEKAVNLISKFINSEEFGKPYQIMGILEANKRLLENYDDKNTIDKVIINLKDLKLKPNVKNIDKEIKDIYTKINKEAKNIYESINKLY